MPSVRVINAVCAFVLMSLTILRAQCDMSAHVGDGAINEGRAVNRQPGFRSGDRY